MKKNISLRVSLTPQNHPCLLGEKINFVKQEKKMPEKLYTTEPYPSDIFETEKFLSGLMKKVVKKDDKNWDRFSNIYYGNQPFPWAMTTNGYWGLVIPVAKIIAPTDGVYPNLEAVVGHLIWDKNIFSISILNCEPWIHALDFLEATGAQSIRVNTNKNFVRFTVEDDGFNQTMVTLPADTGEPMPDDLFLSGVSLGPVLTALMKKYKVSVDVYMIDGKKPILFRSLYWTLVFMPSRG
jgi:hypothetical protein